MFTDNAGMLRKGQQWHAAFDLFNAMRGTSTSPNEVTSAALFGTLKSLGMQSTGRILAASTFPCFYLLQRYLVPSVNSTPGSSLLAKLGLLGFASTLAKTQSVIRCAARCNFL